MIYVIGGNGFVGSAIARACKAQNLNYHVITRDNYNKYTEIPCDILINANGNSKKYISTRDPKWDFDASVKSVFNALMDFKYNKYIQLSSCDVYEDCSSYENTKEDRVLDVTKQSRYGFHKYLAEQNVMHMAKNWIIFRMGGFVGKNLQKNPIFDILNEGFLWLDPKSKLQFINTDEAAEIILKLTQSDISNEIYNLCGKGIICLQDVIRLANRDVAIAENANLVRYEVNIDKILKISEISATHSAVKSFVEDYLNGN